MYNSSHSASIDMTVAARPSNNSMQCLSCHDGTQTIDAIANVPNDTTWANATTKVTGVALFGQNLTSEHPISVKYDNTTGANGDTDFKALTTADDTLPFYGTNSDYVECGSCHDPHDTTYEPFLRITNQNSGLCLTCHTK
jgi:predicted CXXCH cytochrome family protein